MQLIDCFVIFILLTLVACAVAIFVAIGVSRL